MKIENRDRIDDGVELSSEEIHIAGDVKPNSILEAVNLEIDGTTYTDSIQFAREAKIDTHHGTLRSHIAYVNTLEDGEIHATTAHIKSALSGIIYAQDVIIESVSDNLQIFASNSITIKSVNGKNNLFKINYKDVPIINSKLDLINDDIDDLKYSLEDAKKHNISQVTQIEEKIKEFEDEINGIENSTLNGKIIIKEKINESNKIIFELNGGELISFITKTAKYTPFYLEISQNSVVLKPVNQKCELN